MKIALVLLALFAGLSLYFRLAPSDLARWHVTFAQPQERDTANSATRVLAQQAQMFGQLQEIILASPRTKLLAGGASEGKATYVTRSLLWGFPDYTTVWTDGDALILHGRSRFGGGDLGVNRNRLEGWIAALNAT